MSPAEIAPVSNPQLHIRIQGRSIDRDLSELDIGTLSTDDQIRRAVSDLLDVPLVKLQAFAVDRNPTTGDLTMRPEAEFGHN